MAELIQYVNRFLMSVIILVMFKTFVDEFDLHWCNLVNFIIECRRLNMLSDLISKLVNAPTADVCHE